MRKSNCLKNFLDHGCFATQNQVGDRNQFLAKITKPPPSKSTKKQTSAERNQFIAEITKPPSAEITISNHVLASTGTGIHKSVKQCKSLRCREAKPPPREAPWTPSQNAPRSRKGPKRTPQANTSAYGLRFAFGKSPTRPHKPHREPQEHPRKPPQGTALPPNDRSLHTVYTKQHMLNK